MAKRLSAADVAALLIASTLFGLSGSPGNAADEPDLIFKRSTVFKWLTPDDKLATYGIDDPEVDGVACHFTIPEKGGLKGWIGVAEEVSDISLACRQIGPIRFKKEIRAGRGRVPRPPVAVLQEDADRARLRCEAQRACLHGLFRQAHRRLAKELDLDGAGDAVGRQRRGAKMCGLGGVSLLMPLRCSWGGGQ
jgi:CreA protein